MNQRTLAMICRCCPVCITARCFPDSKFAKKVNELEKDCPACRAYKQVYGRKNIEKQP